MSSEEAINNADILLRKVPSAKISTNIAKKPPPKVTEEMQILRLNKVSQEYVMDTLKYIHGQDFKLNDQSSYQDKGTLTLNKYTTGHGNLVIQSFCDYSNTENEPENEVDRFRMFAIMRLESYGFHKEHCEEGLEYCNGDIEETLSLLYEKYFKLKRNDKFEHDYSEKELLEQRVDEKGVLESIYEDSFKEKIQNSVWIVTLKLDYIVKLFDTKKVKRKQEYNHTIDNRKKKEKCRNFLKDQTCKYGNNCRFSHELEAKPDINSHLDDYYFELEIRFDKALNYPFEPPLIFLKTNAILTPQLNLHICKRLYQEAEILAADGIASAYSIIELLKNEEEMLKYLKSTEICFLSRDEKLFPKIIEVDKTRLNRPTHYKKGVTNRSNKKNLTSEDLMRDDKKIAEKFNLKKNEARYIKMQNVRYNLPAWSLKNTILNTIKSSQVVVISGETGCGKSTQVPQYILDEWLSNYNNEHVEIICTQPRRISAIGVAERVAEERIEKVGDSIGYQIRLESKMSSNTRLTFCTTGILLRRLEIDPLLANVTHIVIDEVHERSVESDFLLLILRDLLTIRNDLKVILMSATLNAKIFSNYFNNVPVVDIPGRTHPVEQIFLEDILDIIDYVFEETSDYARNVNSKTFEKDMETFDVSVAHSKPKDVVKDENLKISEVAARYKDYSMKTIKNLYMMDPDRVNLDLIEQILVWIVSAEHSFPKTGSILIFLPGISEITSLYEQLSLHPEFNPKHGKYLLLPLHSSLTSAEQTKVFEKPKGGARKIVISTNIAETSITIDDCTFVIDSGKMKETHFDSNRNMESLETVWVTRANALQRKGRAGRVMPGVCFHLYTSHRFKNHFLSQPIPEIHRIPLEQLILNIKILQNFVDKKLHDVLERTLEPPVKENIDSSIIRLQNVGALDSYDNLTALGHHLAALPVDVRIGKLMLYGAIFSCIDSALTMAACLSYKTPFVTPFGKKEAVTMKKKKFSLGFSDQMTVLTAYNHYQEVNKKSSFAAYNFAKENFLSLKTLDTIADVKYQFLELLVSIGFIPVDLGKKSRPGQDNILALTGAEFNKNGNNISILSSILCAALYPNVCKVLQPAKSFVQSSVGAVPKQNEAKDFRFKTKQEQVNLHPSSMLFEVNHFSSPFLVYQEKVKTSKIFIRDCCMVPAIPLVLFSGFDINISVHKGSTYLSLDDNWIIFEAEEHKIAEMIKMIRAELLDLLEEKIKDPLLNIHHHDKGEKIISTILQLVTNNY